MRNLDKNWEPLLPKLIEAYLKFREDGDAAAPPDADEMEAEETISILDLYTLDTATTFAIRKGQRKAEALMAAGYICNAPLFPSLAISVKTLELFRTIRLFKASFSTEAFTKLLCHHYFVSSRCLGFD